MNEQLKKMTAVSIRNVLIPKYVLKIDMTVIKLKKSVFQLGKLFYME